MLQNKLVNFISIIIFLSSCSTQKIVESKKEDQSLERFRIDPNQKEIIIYCSYNDLQKRLVSKFQLGNIICAKHLLKHRDGYKLKINYRTTNKNNDDLYKKGYWELQVYKGSFNLMVCAPFLS